MTFKKLVLLGDENWTQTMGIFDLIVDPVGLPGKTYNRNMEALKVMKPTMAKSAWENTDNYWMGEEVRTDEYTQALAGRFFVEDKGVSYADTQETKGSES